MTLASQTVLAQVQVPRASSTRDITALETAMLSLTLDAHQPVALDIAGTPTSRAFLLRAATPVALRHLAAQIQARYPQAEITEAPADPLALAPGEVASVVELRPATETYLPLRTLAERELLKEGADPLLGVLAAFSHLPPQSRAVIHLALLPLPATWSRAFRRRAVEHPLEPERRRWQQERTRSEQAPSPIRLVALALLVALLLVGWWVQPIIRAVLPAWMLAAARAVLHGSTPLLTASETMQLLGAGIGTLVFSAALALGGRVLLSRLWRTPIYDMRLVDEKTGRLAYRACLRLVVITPSAHPLPAPVWSWLWRGLRTGGRRSPRQWGTLALAAWQERRRLVCLRRAEILAPQRETLALLAAAFRPYQTASGASLQAHLLSPRLTRRFWRPRRRQPGWVRGVAHARQVLSVADLATLWHLPQAQDVAEVPYLIRGRARTLPAPAALSTGQGYRLGTATHAGQTSPVFLPAECLRHNLLAVASTGKGKSTLFTHLARAAMQEPARGLVVVEPHGDLVATLCGLVPASRREDVVVVDLADRAFPVGLNPLDMTLGRDRDKAVDTLIQIASSLWADSYGPRTENVLEYAAKTLAEANTTLVRADPIGGPARQYTLLDIVPLLRRTSFRHAVLEQVADPVLTDWWATYYEPLDVRMQSEVTSSVITKLSKFASSRVARRMLGQADTSVNVQEIIRQGKILLVSTASGVVGADLSAFLGATLLGLLQATLAEQAELPPDQRRPVLMLIDEFQVYSGVNYQSMLAELRKYGGSFGLATQSLAYLDRFERSLRATVLANIDHLFAFAMAAEDAHLLRLDGVEEADVTALDDFQCYARLSVGGHRLPLFSFYLDPPPAQDTTSAHALVTESQQRSARPVGLVDAALEAALTRQRTAIPSTPVGSADAAVSPTGAGPSGQDGSPRKKRRGRGGGKAAPAPGTPSPTAQAHLMYAEEESHAGQSPHS